MFQENKYYRLLRFHLIEKVSFVNVPTISWNSEVIFYLGFMFSMDLNLRIYIQITASIYTLSLL